MWKKLVIGSMVVSIAFAVTISALASGMNYAYAWETLGGARWNGYVQIQACYNDSGKVNCG